MKVFLNSIDPKMWIIIGVSAAVVAVGVLILVLALKGGKKNKVDAVENKYLEIKELLTGQDATYISRLEAISKSNLKYSDTYERHLAQFKLLVDGDCKYIENLLNALDECLKRKKADSFRKILNDARRSVATFKEKVTDFDIALRETIQPEEDSRVNLVRIKEAYRSLKSKYNVNEKQLGIIAESFNKVFEKIDLTFDQFEDHLEKAEYDEANALLPTLQKVIKSLDDKIEELPALCVEIDHVIPSNIQELGQKVRSLEEQGMNLFNLGFNKKSLRWADELKMLRQSLKDFKFQGARNIISRIQSEIDATYQGLEQELVDKKYFDANINVVCNNVVTFERKYIKLLEKVPELNEVYVIVAQKLNDLEILKDKSNDLSVVKRGLDNYVQSGVKQPYSGLRVKLEEVDEKCKDAQAKLDEFIDYINSIKNDSQSAYLSLYDYYNHLRDVEAKIRSMNTIKYYNERIDQIDACYNLLNDLNASLHAKPLNINSVNEDIKDLKAKADPLIKAVEEDFKSMCLAESAILFNNRDREHQSNVHEKLKVIENQFFNCEFDRAYQEASELYKNNHIGD